MRHFQQLSEFYSEDEKRRASVRRELGVEEGQYIVSVVNASGSSFTSSFNSLQQAENFAEEWVLINE